MYRYGRESVSQERCDDGAGTPIRVIDLMARPPSSRDYGEQEETFDRMVKSMHRRPHRVKYPRKLERWLKDTRSVEEYHALIENADYLISTCMERICADAFDKHGLFDVFDVLHCTVHPIMALLAMLEGLKEGDLFRVCLRSMPSRGGAAEHTIQIKVGEDSRTVNLRLVYEGDRKNTSVGPSVGIINGFGAERKAIVDLSTSSIEPEYIVYGQDEPYDYLSPSAAYITYRHIDSPAVSKTAIPHYRLYNPWGSSYVGNVIFEYPIIIAHMMRAPVGFSNVLQRLPYPSDLLFLMKYRPELSDVVAKVIKLINSGTPLAATNPVAFERQLSVIPSFPLTAVVTEAGYVRTPFSEANHGIGHQWHKLYSEMFK